MKRQVLEKYLQEQGCRFEDRGKRHDIWINPQTRARAPIPRHTEVKLGTARGICRQLGVPLPPGR